MKRLLLLIVVACGSKQPRSSVENRASEPPREPGQARVIERQKMSGVIELDGDRDAAMRAAQQEMAKHCGDSYKIVREGEEVIDEARARTAWRVHYECLIDI